MKQKIFIGEIFNQLSAKWPGLWMAARLGDLVLIQTSLCFCYVNHVVLMLTRCIYMTEASVSKVCIKPKSPPASLPFKCQVTEQRTLKWSICGIALQVLGFSDNSRAKIKQILSVSHFHIGLIHIKGKNSILRIHWTKWWHSILGQECFVSAKRTWSTRGFFLQREIK